MRARSRVSLWSAATLASTIVLLGSAPAHGAFGVVSHLPGFGTSALNLGGLATDAAGNVYVLADVRVRKFDPAGTVLAEWGASGIGDGQFRDPSGIAVDPFGNVYVADSGNDRIQKFDANGVFLGTLGGPGAGDGQFDNPSAVATDAAGNLYVAEIGNDRVQKLDPTGAFLAKWGSAGSGPGQFADPFGIAVSGGGVYVADTGNDRMQQFTADGAFVREWGATGAGPGQFERPQDVATGPEGVYVGDSGSNARVQVFSADGAFSREFGCHGLAAGALSSVSSLGVDPFGSVYVGSFTTVTRLILPNARIQKFGDPGAALPCKQLEVSEPIRQVPRRLRIHIECPAQPCELTITGEARVRDREAKLQEVERSVPADGEATIPLRFLRPGVIPRFEELLEKRKLERNSRVVVNVLTAADPTNNYASREVGFKLRSPGD